MLENLSDRTIKGYELREMLGAGGFGAVYRAYQPAVGREVAVKVILPAFANHPDFIRRFENEAQVVARLEHPFIVPLYDYWREPNGAYLVMRMLRGGSLRQKIDSLPVGQTFDPQLALRLIDQIAGALTVAHRNGVIHRDLKPDNILLDEEGNGFLTDFGIAKVGHEDEESSSHGITGSPGYIAPEQIIGGDITPQTDIYSFGVIIYELVVGRHPFAGMPTGQMIIKHLQEPLPDFARFRPDLDPAVNAVIQKATAKEPADRFPDAMSVAHAFKRAMGVFQPAQAKKEEENLHVFNPYKGLRPFEESDAADFFGRDALIRQLIERMGEDRPEARFLAVVGPSGSGKSSVVKAGLVPSLRNGALPESSRWFVVEMVPGTDPLRQLEAALLSVAIDPPAHIYERLKDSPKGLFEVSSEILEEVDGELLLVIDQFEEVFTLSEDEAARTHFIKMLYHAILTPKTRLRVIVTLRADFYDKPLLYENFGALMQSRTQVVLPLSAEEIERTIVGPGERANLIVSQDLVAAIIGEVLEEPGALPLLQYALTEVYERREGRRLTLEAYQQSGGVLGALARRAEEVYQELPSKEKALTRQIFLRLVTLGEGSEDTRRRARRLELSALGEESMVEHVIDAYGRFRLLTFDVELGTREPMIEVAHEALIREWTRLREWLDRSRADVRLQRVLQAAHGEWEKSGRDRSYLLGGSRLAQYTEWARTTDIVLTHEEQSYLKASIGERKRQQKLEDARAAREQSLAARSRNVLRMLVAVMVVATCGALTLSGLAFSQSQQAQEARSTSDANAGVAIAAQSTSQAEADNRATQQQMALDSAATAVSAQGLMQIEADSRATQQQIALDNAATAVSAQGIAQEQANLAATQAQNAIDSAATATVAQGAALEQADAAATQAQNALDSGATATYAQGQAQFEADNAQTQAAMAATSASEAQTQAANAQQQSLQRATQQLLAEQNATLSAGNAATAAAAATQSAINANQAVANEGTANARATQAYINEQSANQQSTQAAISANQAATEAALAQQAAATAAAAQATSEYQSILSDSLALAASSSQALANGDRPLAMHLALLAQDKGNEIASLAAQVYPPARVLSNLADNAYSIGLRRTYTRTGTDLIEVEYVNAGTPTLIYLQCTSNTDCFLFVVDPESGDLLRRIQVPNEASPTIDITDWAELAVSPDNNHIFVTGRDGRVKMMNFVTGVMDLEFNVGTSRLYDIKLSNDGTQLLTISADAKVRIWNTANAALINEFSVPAFSFSADISNDKSEVIVGGPDTIGRYNAATGAYIEELEYNRGFQNTDVTFSPDGRFLVTVNNGTVLYVWDADNGYTLTFVLRGHPSGIQDIAFSPDGTMLASVDQVGSVRIWDAVELNEYRANRTIAEFKRATTFIYSVAFAPDDNTVATVSAGGTARVWDVNLRADYLGQYASQPSNQQLALVYNNANTQSMQLYCTGSPCSTYMGRVVETQNGAEVRTFSLAISGNILSSAILGDLSRIAVLSDNDHLYLFDGNGTLLQEVDANLTGKLSSVFTPDGTQLITGSAEGAQIWNAANGAFIASFPDSVNVVGVQLNRAGSQLFGVVGQNVRVWNVNDRSVRRTVRLAIGTGRYDFQISQDGSYGFVSTTASQDLINLNTGLVTNITASPSKLSSPRFTPDGRLLLGLLCSGACEEQLLVAWDAATGIQVRSFQTTIGDQGVMATNVSQLAISPDNRRVLTVADNGTLREWRMPLPTLLHSIICNTRFARNLTVAEQAAYNVMRNSPCADPEIDFMDAVRALPPAADSLASMDWITADDSPSLAGAVRIEAESPLVGHENEWLLMQNEALTSGGAYMMNTNKVNSGLTLAFEGSAVEIGYLHHRSFGTIIVEIDGVPFDVIDTAGDRTLTPGRRVIEGLTPGPHIVRVLPQNAIVSIDYFAVMQPLATETPVASPTPMGVPLPVFATMDDGAPDWSTSGGWTLSDTARLGDSGQGWMSLPETGTHTLTWGLPIDLSAAEKPELMFYSTLHSVRSTALIEVSTDGQNWMPVAGVPNGDWTPVRVDLTMFNGATIWLRWTWDWQPPENDAALPDFWWIDGVFVGEAPDATATPEPTDTETPTETLEPGVTPSVTPEPSWTPETTDEVPVATETNGAPTDEVIITEEPVDVTETAEPPTVEVPTDIPVVEVTEESAVENAVPTLTETPTVELTDEAVPTPTPTATRRPRRRRN